MSMWITDHSQAASSELVEQPINLSLVLSKLRDTMDEGFSGDLFKVELTDGLLPVAASGIVSFQLESIGTTSGADVSPLEPNIVGGTYYINVGHSSVVFSDQILEDNLTEGLEYYVVRITGASGASFSTVPESITIVDTSLSGSGSTPVTPVAGSYRFYGAPMPVRGLTNASPDPANIAISTVRGEEISYSLEYKGTRIDSVKWYTVVDNAGGYSKGDGGLLKVQIQGDNGGFADGNVLGETPEIIASPKLWNRDKTAAQNKYPGKVWTHHGETGTALDVFREFDLAASITGMTPGTRIHLVFKNVTPDPQNHHIGVNMVGSGDGNPTYRKNNKFDDDPAFASGFDWKANKLNNGVWSDIDGLMGIMEVVGDVAQGNVRYAVSNAVDPSGRGDRTPNISGTRMVREHITPPSALTFKEVGLFMGRNSGSSPVSCVIKQGGSLLWSGSFSGFPLLGDVLLPQGAATAIVEKSSWVSQAADFSCVADTPMTMELSTDSGTDYEVPMSQDAAGVYFVGTTGLSTGFKEGHAEESLDGGTSWQNIINSGSRGEILDCIFYFEIV